MGYFGFIRPIALSTLRFGVGDPAKHRNRPSESERPTPRFKSDRALALQPTFRQTDAHPLLRKLGHVPAAQSPRTNRQGLAARIQRDLGTL